MSTPAADDRRFYVLTLRGDLGPFDRATLAEKLRDGSVRPTDQVRNAFGRIQGTVAEALDARRERTAAPTHRATDSARSGPHRPAAGPRLLPVAIIGALLLAVAALALLGRGAPPEVARPPAPMAPKMPPVQPVARPAVPAAPQLVIRKAVYGALPDGPSADVTRIVAAAVKNGHLSIRAGNSQFGDPVQNKVKQLQVDYLWNGEERAKTVAEDSVLTISDQGR